MTILATIPSTVTPADFKIWAEAVSEKLDTLPEIPSGAVAVLATTSQAVADAHPEFAWIVLT